MRASMRLHLKTSQTRTINQLQRAHRQRHILVLPQGHVCLPVRGHGGQSPEWQITEQWWWPQDNRTSHTYTTQTQSNKQTSKHWSHSSLLSCLLSLDKLWLLTLTILLGCGDINCLADDLTSVNDTQLFNLPSPGLNPVSPTSTVDSHTMVSVSTHQSLTLVLSKDAANCHLLQPSILQALL